MASGTRHFNTGIALAATVGTFFAWLRHRLAD